MVFGGTANERLQLNEDTLYAGGPYDPNNTEGFAVPAGSPTANLWWQI